ncbi:hypothetical protein Hanom_Chr10g00926641 [Helianthus anomalus]
MESYCIVIDLSIKSTIVDIALMAVFLVSAVVLVLDLVRSVRILCHTNPNYGLLVLMKKISCLLLVEDLCWSLKP